MQLRTVAYVAAHHASIPTTVHTGRVHMVNPTSALTGDANVFLTESLQVAISVLSPVKFGNSFTTVDDNPFL